MDRYQIILIDSDVRRRAGIAHALTNMAAFVVPLEHYAEISQAWPEEAIVMIEDKGDAVASLRRVMQRHNRDLPLVVLCAQASPERKSQMLFDGATACLPWPCDIERMRTTIEAIVARRQACSKAASGSISRTDDEKLAALTGFPQLAPDKQLLRLEKPTDADCREDQPPIAAIAQRRRPILTERPLVQAAPGPYFTE